ncbi:MarR family winged helix-turn-helix transcriptional regulator [Tenacibaculum sp. ZS6-P6]|uniref:MarR family winged helix-turn-helix transcriptional regulator n=1 Tax=Tenacibaculum sp. ZS6-P6 TaxID=3447503 RepID=UPI003F9722BF
MNESTFNPEQQEKDISSKIVAGLERVSEVFKKLLWEKAKLIGLSPIQIQILIFITFHRRDLCNVSHLAKEFNVTKPTISDAIRVLHKKELIIKDYSSSDNRSYTIILSEKGKEIVNETQGFSNPLKNQIDNFEQQEKESLFESLSTLIHKLNKNGILSVQRTCYGCKFYQKSGTSHFCNLLNTQLLTTEIRLDCPDFEAKK